MIPIDRRNMKVWHQVESFLNDYYRVIIFRTDSKKHGVLNVGIILVFQINWISEQSIGLHRVIHIFCTKIANRLQSIPSSTYRTGCFTCTLIAQHIFVNVKFSSVMILNKIHLYTTAAQIMYKRIYKKGYCKIILLPHNTKYVISSGRTYLLFE